MLTTPVKRKPKIGLTGQAEGRGSALINRGKRKNLATKIRRQKQILKPLSLSAFVAEKRSVLATSNKQPATRISYTTYFSYIEPGNVTEKAEL